MPKLKDITELPLAESAEGVNVIVNDNGAAKQIPANAVGIKSWNDLEDKPFGSEGEEEVVKLATYDGFFNPESDIFMVLENFSEINVTEGDMVKVVWDGEVYECKVERFPYQLIFGNRYYFGSHMDNGLPFNFNWTEAGGWTVAAYDTSSTSHTFGVTKIKTKKIDPCFLPTEDSLYDLILEYHGQIHYSCVPEAYEVEVYPKENVKKVIEKVNQGISAKVLFRHREYGGIPSYCIETPMQITVFENSMRCCTLIYYYDEGTVFQFVDIYLNEDGTCGWIGIDNFG